MTQTGPSKTDARAPAWVGDEPAAGVVPVRHAPDDDALVDVLALLRSSFAHMDGRIDPPSSLHRLHLADVRAHCETGEIWSVGRPPRACVFLAPHPEALYLGRLAVAERWRGRGIARALVELAAARARARALPALELNVRVELVENRRAFAAMGFEEVSEHAHPGYDRPTFVGMRRAVAPG